ncbi:MAG TPA: histidine--tRNA ligase, partial [Candidatus Paceibacterota bacterium]
MAEKQKNQDLQTPKGMHDILPADYPFYEHVYTKCDEVTQYYGFQPIETPLLEKIELFTRTLGETTDIVEKEMYTLRTRGGDVLALRPEGTAPVMRAYLEHGMHTLPQPVMLFYKGPFFRHESPQFGRFREFRQYGLEILGEEKSIGDAIIIQAFYNMLEEIKVSPIVVKVNSLGDKECRPAYRRELVSYYRRRFHQLCKDCKRRFKDNPFRLLDCKDEKCIELKREAPQMISHLCGKCKESFKEVLEFLEASKIPYIIDNYLVR